MNSYTMTLAQWQQIIKPQNELIVQASTIDGNDGLTAMSIGMGHKFAAFITHTMNKITNNIQPQFQSGNHDQLVMCAIAETTDSRRRPNGINRKSILKTLSNNNIENVLLSGDDYFTALPNYKFVVSPEGNGIDCHRHYEALIAGCIPIVEDNPIIRAKYGNVPILWTRDYREITPTYLEEKYAQMLATTWDFSQLFLSWWSEEEQLLARFRGNYWCMKLEGLRWYNEEAQMGAYINRNTATVLKVHTVMF